MATIQFVQIVPAAEPIESSAWDELVASDPDLEAVSSIPGRDPRTMEAIDFTAPHSARWVGHPDGVPFYFHFNNGTIVVGSTDSHGVAKAKSIASTLGASIEVSDD